MKLYENVVIGNFLYGLGFAIAKRTVGRDFPSIVNLLQQTPDDAVLGDLLFKAPGLLRIIEFKQCANTDSKEPERHERLRKGLAHSEAMTRVSREVHWFVETKPTQDSFTSRIVPYLDAYPRKEEEHDFATFVISMAEAATRGTEQCTLDETNTYLGWLAALNKSGSVGSGGLVVKMQPNGDLQYAALVSVMELVLSRQLLVKRRAQAAVIEAAKEQSRERHHGYGRG